MILARLDCLYSLKTSEKGKVTKRDYNAGAKLLARYQEDWEELHANSERNAKLAAAIDKEIEKCYDSAKNERFAIKKFNSDVSDLGNVIVLTEKAVNAIGNIRSLIDDIQDEILIVEELIDREGHLRKMSEATDRLDEFRKEQLISLDALKERLAEDYEEKLKKLEQEKEDIQKKNFQMAEIKFLKELNAYKETGELPKKETVKPTLSIEEVEIDQDMSTLQEYLQT